MKITKNTTTLVCDLCKRETNFFANEYVAWEHNDKRINLNFKVGVSGFSDLYLKSDRPFITILNNGNVQDTTSNASICKACLVEIIKGYIEVEKLNI